MYLFPELITLSDTEKNEWMCDYVNESTDGCCHLEQKTLQIFLIPLHMLCLKLLPTVISKVTWYLKSLETWWPVPYEIRATLTLFEANTLDEV
jgi:hypothetical protein